MLLTNAIHPERMIESPDENNRVLEKDAQELECEVSYLSFPTSNGAEGNNVLHCSLN